MESKPFNLSLPAEVIAAVRQYVQHRKRFRRGFSASEMVTNLLTAKLRKEGIQLPAEYYLKDQEV